MTASFNTKQLSPKACINIGLLLFAITWIGTGTQHLLYIEFVARLVPRFLPAKPFWAWLTGLGMILAGISFLIRYKTALAAVMLSIMLGFFVVLIHIDKVSGSSHSWITWFRFIQDLSILGACFLITNESDLVKIGRCVYGGAILAMGIAHFYHPESVTARIPAYFPAKHIFDYIIGVLLIIASGCIIFKFRITKAALALAILLLIFALLYSAPPLIKNIKDAGQWTDLLLDLAVTAGAFFTAGKFSDSKALY